MCTPIPAHVISMEADTALVEYDGRKVSVSSSGLAGVLPGDWVLVYLGHIVSRVSLEEASALQELLQALGGP
jgi:hydrogenase assembly chaperone HypC/HupF